MPAWVSVVNRIFLHFFAKIFFFRKKVKVSDFVLTYISL